MISAMTAFTAPIPTPRDSRQETGHHNFLPQHMT
jgi:hypothetical protein